MMVRELGFEMKAQPSNRMKTEEELAKEEQERLKKLEVGVTCSCAGGLVGLLGGSAFVRLGCCLSYTAFSALFCF
jgi:hypothetical protein